jgi:phosphodiesterase/alkaline phosphatase D-like protein
MTHLILGHTTDRSIRIWVRAMARWPAAFVDVLDEDDRPTAPTQVLETTEEDFHTAVVDWGDLAPERTYRVKVAFGKTRRDGPEGRVRQAYCEGRFSTFPQAGAPAAFRFVFGSCNLHSMGLIARPDRAWAEIGDIARRHEASFMLHCGDQIYADIPFAPSASLAHYRDKYLDAWEDCVPAQRILTERPHYMTLDDHEIDNNFDGDRDRDGRPDNSIQLAFARKVYWEFQHSHNPPTSARQYHYSFAVGAAHFFVLNTRIYRNSGAGQMIDLQQERELLAWLLEHRDALKFVISSVPFAAVPKDDGDDKWCGQPYAAQRGRILAHLVRHGIERLVFLTGDMHNSMHSTLDIRQDGAAVRVHELMSSPINQITPDTPLRSRYRTPDLQRLGRLEVESTVEARSFYAHSNVMLVDVSYTEGAPRVGFRIFRTTKSQVGPQGEFLP